ncbi:MAG: hypothetical protein JWP49_2133 [Phenylobacterium sp.]|nr:hypothetical protein [Phenylobacterium sp.]
MNRTIAVRPAGPGWSLRIDAQEGVLVFQTGAQAESTARGLARRLAEAGEVTDILIYLRDGSLAGQLRSTPLHPAAYPQGGPGRALEPAAA